MEKSEVTQMAEYIMSGTLKLTNVMVEAEDATSLAHLAKLLKSFAENGPQPYYLID